MNVHVKTASSIVIIGLLLTITWKVIEPYFVDSAQIGASDSSQLKKTIRIAMDGWVGYYPLCSKQMRKQLRDSGYGLKCINDNADYKTRYKGLKNKEYDFAVGTVDSYILNGARVDFPGPIVAVIDESSGGDAIVAWEAKLPNIEALKQSDNAVGAFTPDSPSHHFAKAISTHFDISVLREPSLQRLTDGSAAALKTFLSKKSDYAILWEPDLSKALNEKGVVRLLGTEDTQQLIVDILIASQSIVRSDPDVVVTVLKSYFKTLKFYRNNEDVLVNDIADEFDISTATSKALLSGVKWASLVENANRWYGVNNSGFSEDALVETIESTVDVLLDNKDFSDNPIPGEDAYRLLNSSFVKKLDLLYSNVGSFTTKGASSGSTKAKFSPLSNEKWDRLEDVGSLKVRKIVFSSGTSELTNEGKQQVDALMSDLKHYPNFRVEVRGHTSIKGNKDANIALSQQRADAVLRYISVTYGFDVNGLRSIGFGGSSPLPMKAGESQGSRSWLYRLPRVEIALVREVI
jgi:outer membrane protein OmpA-like peptidoglycan-associated protein